MAGRKRIPTKIKIIRGTFRKDRVPEHEPEPEPVRDMPKPPPDLPSAGKKLWKKLAAELVDKKVLTVVDLPALEVCCLNYGLFKELHRAIHKKIEDPVTGKLRKRTLAEYMQGKSSQTMPEYVQMARAFTTFKSYLTEFGLTPSSRARLDIPEAEPEEVDPIERMWNES
jgi:P27 family predicted phage terminase small subunit